ncbi:hypothetical protein CSA_017720, partial [Cucumis sativus]
MHNCWMLHGSYLNDKCRQNNWDGATGGDPALQIWTTARRDTAVTGSRGGLGFDGDRDGGRQLQRRFWIEEEKERVAVGFGFGERRKEQTNLVDGSICRRCDGVAAVTGERGRRTC